jgi:hypothetical protein
MRAIGLAAVALALSACGGGETANEANALTADNLMVDENLMLDSNASMNGVTGLDGNGSVDAGTQNMMQKDATTNDPDTNLANGL